MKILFNGKSRKNGAPKSRAAFLPMALLTCLLSHSAFADGGAVLAEKIQGPYRITLFGSPAPLRAGAADLSVFIQDAKTGEPILDRVVTVQLKAAAAAVGTEAWVPPCCSMKFNTHPVAATHAAAQNKLLYAANLLIPSSGPHEILVRIGDHPDDAPLVTAPVEIAAALPPATTFWAYLAFPPVAIIGFALNQRLRRRA